MLPSLLNTDEVNIIIRIDDPAISEMSILSMAKIIGHNKSFSGSSIRLEWAVSYHVPEFTSPSKPLGDSYS
jgi:hypothetical protein